MSKESSTPRLLAAPKQPSVGPRRTSRQRGGHLHGQARHHRRSECRLGQATIERIQSDIDDSTLKAPRDGRVQYRISQPGEVLNGGGKVLNMVDLADVYMTFFLPRSKRVSQDGAESAGADAAPQLVIPAKVCDLSDVACSPQDGGDTWNARVDVRLKAHIDKELLEKYVHDVKTGLPGWRT
jgi:HlyD family secretion protein